MRSGRASVHPPSSSPRSNWMMRHDCSSLRSRRSRSRDSLRSPVTHVRNSTSPPSPSTSGCSTRAARSGCGGAAMEWSSLTGFSGPKTARSCCRHTMPRPLPDAEVRASSIHRRRTSLPTIAPLNRWRPTRSSSSFASEDRWMPEPSVPHGPPYSCSCATQTSDLAAAPVASRVRSIPSASTPSSVRCAMRG